MSIELFNSYKGEAMLPTPGSFEVYSDGVENVATKFRKPRTDKGVPRGPRKPVKVEKAKGKAGRPRVYNGNHRRIVAAALKRHGYTKGLEFLATERGIKVSMTLARDVAKELGLTFTRGRPKAA
jgi:transposase